MSERMSWENEKSYRKKMLDIRKKIKLGKDGKVDIGGGRSYNARFAEAVFKAFMPKLNEANIDITCIGIQCVDASSTNFSGVFTYRFTDCDTGYYEDLQTTGGGADRTDKANGKAITYALKYLLTTRFFADVADDPDHKSSEVDVEESKTHLHNLLQAMVTEKYFMSETVNPSGEEKDGIAIYKALGTQISNNLHNGPWLMKKEEELETLLKEFRRNK
ncbi:ERF family protein [Candidatus Pacearchaeota archaeon]|nr:ERF family protein [Candidatus Pacearchaeota archaeon]